jgi:hypothetical protein
LALGLVVGCKQQIEGSLNVTATNYNKNLDNGTTKVFYYKATGAFTQTTKSTSVYRASTTSDVYTSNVDEWVTTYTPTSDVKVTITENPLTNVTQYTYTWNYAKEITRTGTNYSLNSSTVSSTYKYVYNKDRKQNSWDADSVYLNTHTITIYKIDGKYYANDKAQDGSEIVVTEGFDPLANTVELSKFSDTTSTTAESWSNTVADTTASFTTNVPANWLSKTTTVTGGWVSTISLAKK